MADAASWGSYGLAIGDPALQMYGIVLLATAAAVLLRLRAVDRSPVAAPHSPIT